MDNPLDLLDRAVLRANLFPYEVIRRHRDHDVHKCTVRRMEWDHQINRDVCHYQAGLLVRALESLGIEARIGTEDPVGIEIVFAEVLPADVLETCERVDNQEDSRCAS